MFQKYCVESSPSKHSDSPPRFAPQSPRTGSAQHTSQPQPPPHRTPSSTPRSWPHLSPPVCAARRRTPRRSLPPCPEPPSCLLYTSDAADDLLCVDLGGRRIIKKK